MQNTDRTIASSQKPIRKEDIAKTKIIIIKIICGKEMV